MLIIRSIFFTIVFPGSVTILIPHFIVGHGYGLALSRPLWAWIGLFPLGAGIVILFRCIWDFAVTGRGTLAPVDPPTQLVITGLYRYVRNPMYLGVLCILSGEALLFVSTGLLIYTLAVFLVVHLFVVFFEEPMLRRQFGESYQHYTRKVPRWLPLIP